MMDPQTGIPCVIEIAEGERRRCPCERKIKLLPENQIAPPTKERVISKKLLVRGGAVLVTVLLLILIFIPKLPGIEIEDVGLQFDATRIGEERPSRLTVRNVGKGDLIIHSASAIPSVFAVAKGDEAITVGPGESAEITVLFRPVEGTPPQGTLTIASNDPKSSSREIELVGRIAVSLEEAFEVFNDLDSESPVFNQLPLNPR